MFVCIHPAKLGEFRHMFDNKMVDGFFPIQFDALKAEIRYLDRLSKGSLEIDGTVIDRIPLQHPQGGFGFRFREGKRILVFVTDNELRAYPCFKTSQSDEKSLSTIRTIFKNKIRGIIKTKSKCICFFINNIF